MCAPEPAIRTPFIGLLRISRGFHWVSSAIYIHVFDAYVQGVECIRLMGICFRRLNKHWRPVSSQGNMKFLPRSPGPVFLMAD
ncbi:hypothetical protein CC2G_012952 [Coprinopsis cinerea AmutBmut pab1-1]|nr:hypothetical protein CC2G_012952 [Coprinopsis cinerea AmutBmut pab1-1]